MTRLQTISARLILLWLAWWVCVAPAQAYTPDEVSQLVAPVALYPDALLSNVLAASAYPDEIVGAQQWVQQNGAMPAANLDAELASVNWDPSVKSLTAFPSVLGLLAGNLPWTEALGDAFLTQPDDVDAAIQSLRLAAMQNGDLQTNAQVIVTYVNGAVVIESANPDYVYLPAYDPETVYYQGDVPVVYGPAIYVGQYLWLGVWDWRFHHLYFGRGYNYFYRGHLGADNPQYQRILSEVSNHAGAWQFNAAHRRGRPVPSISQLNQGRGFSTPVPNLLTPGRPNGVRPVPGGQVHPNPPGQILPTNVPSLFNVRPGSTVNAEQSQGAQSRHVDVPAPVRPVAPPTFSRPTGPPPVPAPRPAPPPPSHPAPHTAPHGADGHP